MSPSAEFCSQTVQIDWFRFNVPVEFRREAGDVLREFGFTGLEQCRGQWSFEHGEKGDFGATVYWDGLSSKRSGGALACFELPGAWCSRVRDWSKLLRRLSAIHRFKVTRFDIAVDFFEFRTHEDAPRSLCDCVEDAAEDEVYVGARSARTIRERKNGRLGRTIYFGTRGGDGSGRFIRVYDKGAEQGGCERRWERFEVELTDDVASKAVARLVAVEPAECLREAYDIAVSCIDFRDDPNNPRTCERPRSGWWAFVARGVDRIIRASRVQRSTLTAAMSWLRNGAVQAMQELADQAGISVSAFVTYLVGDNRTRSRVAERVRAEWAEEITELWREGRPGFA